ncbi:MAG TPA: hypothetical protein VIK90_02995 [Limnochordales bacterium]
MLPITVVGSYPKLPEGSEGPNVRNAINRFESGRLSVRELEQTVRETVARVIREQEEAGVDLVTDGQIRWDDLVTPFARDLGSVEIGGLVRYFDNNVYYRRPLLKGRIWFRGSSLAWEVRQARALTRRGLKVALPGPFTFVRLSLDEHYGDLARALADAAEALNLEARALAEAGADVIQFDEPALLFDATPDERRLAREALATAREGLGVPVALHTYFRDAGPLFEELAAFPVDILGFDLASGPDLARRLAGVRLDQKVTLGLVDGRGWRLEPADELARTIEAVASRQGWDRVLLSPSCGLEFLPQGRALAKLRRLAEARALVAGAPSSPSQKEASSWQPS